MKNGVASSVQSHEMLVNGNFMLRRCKRLYVIDIRVLTI